MRSLSPELLAAQRSPSAVPYLQVTVRDRIGGIRRLAFQRLYTGSEPDGYHAATMPGDGSLLRARVAAGRLYYQRVTSPGPSSDFSPWTDLGAVANVDVALCSERTRTLWGAVNELPRKQRDVIVGVFACGLTNRQVARELGLRNVHVRQLRWRALRQLREWVRDA